MAPGQHIRTGTCQAPSALLAALLLECQVFVVIIAGFQPLSCALSCQLRGALSCLPFDLLSCFCNGVRTNSLLQNVWPLTDGLDCSGKSSRDVCKDSSRVAIAVDCLDIAAPLLQLAVHGAATMCKYQ